MSSRGSGSFGEYRSWKEWDVEEFARCNSSDARYFEVELTRAGVNLASAISVLEIGFGNGTFARWATERGWTYVGVEIDPELISRGRQRGLDVVDASLSLEGVAAQRKFDLVIALDVLEHMPIPDISTLFSSSKNILNSRGRIIARFPSGDSPFSRAIQYGDLTHRSVLGSGIVQQLAIKTGFEVFQVRPPAFPLLGVGLRRAMRRSIIAVGRAVLARVFQLLYFDNQRRVMTPNMLVVLLPVRGETD